MPEVVDPRYLDGGVLAFPLPPLVGRDWGSEVTHSEIPLAVDAVPEEDEEAEEKKKPAAEAKNERHVCRRRVPRRGMGGRCGGDDADGGRGGMDGRRRPRRLWHGGYGGGRGGYGGGHGWRRLWAAAWAAAAKADGGGGYAGGGGRGGLGADGEPPVPHWLLRFFDFSVEPGKKYKYRVRLAMLDPNQSFGARRVEPSRSTRR